MPALYLSELPADSELRQLPKYAVGDRMRIVRVNVGDINNYPPDTQATFKAAIGRVLTIKEVMFWENDPGKPYHVTYEFYVAHLVGEPNRRSYLQSIYLVNDEIEPIKKRKPKS